MAYKNNNRTIDNDRFAALLKEAVLAVKTEEDPIVLTEYKKLFKRNVPLTLRSYVAAFLALKVSSANISIHSNYNKNNDRKSKETYSKPKDSKESRFSKKTVDTPAEETASKRVIIDESVAATIFISIGRNRRVFPKDLVGLLIQEAGLTRDRIGSIRVLDNYSFIQLFAEDADKVIQSLNGFEYRGRKLNVSHSKKREETSTEEESKQENLI